MKFVTFSHLGRVKVGRLVEDDATIVDLSAVATGMLDLIERHAALGDKTRGFDDPALPRIALAEARLLAPIPRPARNVFCVGKNYREHAQEFSRSGFDASAGSGAAVPDLPIIFSKPPSSVSGPGDAIDSSLDSLDSVDYEAELTIVIGRRGRVGPGDDPWDFVFGYTLVNDVTSRELQKRHKQWLLGKGIDGFCPMGPAIVTRAALPDIGAARLTCHVNGELRQSAPVSDLIFDIPTLVKTIGRGITLEPGDLIATGTPAGVGIGFLPPRYLKRGDVVRIELAGIGVLENPVA